MVRPVAILAAKCAMLIALWLLGVAAMFAVPPEHPWLVVVIAGVMLIVLANIAEAVLKELGD